MKDHIATRCGCPQEGGGRMTVRPSLHPEHEEYTITVRTEDETPGRKPMTGNAESISAAWDCARALCHHYGEQTARITNTAGEAWIFHAEHLEEV